MADKNLSNIDVAQITKNKNLLANIGIILLALFIARNIHLGQVQKINLLKEQIKKENQITVFIDILKSLEDKIELLQKGFQVNLTSDKLIERVSTMAQKRNLRIASINAQPPIDKKIYQIIPIELRLSCDYHKLGHFIADLENTAILRVTKLEFNSKQIYYSEKPVDNEVILSLVAISLKK